MNITRLSLKNIASRPLTTGLSLLLLTLGVGLISLVLQVNKHVEGQLLNNVRGIDMVVGAKGSPLQLILSSVLHVDAPTGNIPLKSTKRFDRNPLVKSTIPLSYGDSYKGHRIVGTTKAYPELYSATVSNGKLWANTMEVTIGASAAAVLNLGIGDTFSGNHGLDAHGEEHAAQPYTVVGVFEPTGTVLDQLLVTNLESVWDVHSHAAHGHNEHDNEGQAHAEPEREITALLVSFKSPMGLLTIPRSINSDTKMQAALPAYEINRLFGLLGVGIDTLNALALIIMLVSGISVFISLYNALRDRIQEMALMRTYGASRGQLFWLVLLEGIVLSVVGFVLGIVASRLAMVAIGNLAASEYRYQLDGLGPVAEEGWLLLVTLLIGAGAALLPAIKAVRVDISSTLKGG